MVKITLLHPDLGIGGAERLVVDAALALKKQGHDVNFVTTHHDHGHCFAETLDGTIPVTVVGDWIPRHIFKKFYALLAYIRMIYAACYMLLVMSNKPDIVICDLVSICIPFLRLFRPKIIFYCHHPDQLLSTRGSLLKTFYRIPLNYLEQITTGQADKIFVNSCYTLEVFKKTFTKLTIQPDILYPSIHTEFFDSQRISSLEKTLDQKLPHNSNILLSINRYERKKNLGLALYALAELKNLLSTDEWNKTLLIMAGGYDKRVEENVDHYMELCGMADELGISDKVLFLRSPSDNDKMSLLKYCKILIYTPPNEHFGIVPLEAMYFEKPVIAHNSGGPRETIINNNTGFLIDELNGQAFAQSIVKLINDETMRLTFGENGKNRVMKIFSFDAFSEQLNKTVMQLSSL
ncbi:alpha-1,3/1,6-mannosyltransferase ALG2 [Aphidius gifuensis]|nr:alpha-1,3/1,6-mannosyltransferase ALG2 [Aphidius gifuensis]